MANYYNYHPYYNATTLTYHLDMPGPSNQPSPGSVADHREAHRVECMRADLDDWHDHKLYLQEQQLRQAAASEAARAARAAKAARLAQTRAAVEARMAAEAATRAETGAEAEAGTDEGEKARWGGTAIGWIRDLHGFLRGEAKAEGGDERGRKRRSDDGTVAGEAGAGAGAGGDKKRQRSRSR